MLNGGAIVDIILNVNENDIALRIEPGEMLCDSLNRIGFKSVRKACGTGSCGVCTVLLDERPIPSCLYMTAKAEGHRITTIEGVRQEAEKVAGIMAEEGTVQCGFCNTGFVLTVISMKTNMENPCDNDIKNYLAGNLCRCSGYQGQLRAVKKYLGVSE